MTLVNKMFNDCKTDEEPALKKISENCMRSQLVSKMIIYLYNTMNFTYFLRTIVSYIFDTVEDRKYLAQVTFPFDGRQSPAYEIIVIGQFITACLCFNSQALIEGLLATSVTIKIL